MTAIINILAIIGAISVLRSVVKIHRDLRNLNGGPTLMRIGAGVRVVSGSTWRKT